MVKKVYKLLVRATRDKPPKTFEAGSKVTAKDFPASVLAQWAQDGFAEELSDSEAGGEDGSREE